MLAFIVRIMTKRPHTMARPTANLPDVPPHILASVLHGALIVDVFRVAHVCRALHERIVGTAECRCARQGHWLRPHDPTQRPAFWTLWNEANPVRRSEYRLYVRFNKVVCVDYILRWVNLDAGVPTDLDDLTVASSNDCLEVVRRLLPLAPNARKQDAFYDACREGHVRMVDFWLNEPTVDPSQNNQQGILVAAGQGHTDVVDRLLGDPRVVPNHQPFHTYSTPLIEACIHGHTAVVDCLLRDGRVDPSQHQQHAFRLAWARANDAIVSRLLQDARLDPNHLYAERDRRAWQRDDATKELILQILAHPRLTEQSAASWCLFAARNLGFADVANEMLQRLDFSIRSSEQYLWESVVLQHGLVDARTALASLRREYDTLGKNTLP